MTTDKHRAERPQRGIRRLVRAVSMPLLITVIYVSPCVKAIPRRSDTRQFLGVCWHQFLNAGSNIANFLHSCGVGRSQPGNGVLGELVRKLWIGRQIKCCDRLSPLGQCVSKPAERVDQRQGLRGRFKCGNCHGVPRKRSDKGGRQIGLRGRFDPVNCQGRRSEVVPQLDELHSEFFHRSRRNCSVNKLSPFDRSDDRVVRNASGQPTPKPCKDRRRDCPSLPSWRASLPGPPANAHRIQKLHFLTPQSDGQHSAMPSKPRSGFATLATVKPPRDLRTRLREDV